MKRRRNTIGAAIVFASLFGLLAVPSAFGSTNNNNRETCSNSTLQESFGFTLTGSQTVATAFSNAGARAAVGQLTADGNGNLTGSETQSNDGAIVTDVTETGTYTVNSNCSGSATLTLSMGETRNFNFEILNQHYSSGTEEFVAIVTDADKIETIDFKQQE